MSKLETGVGPAKAVPARDDSADFRTRHKVRLVTATSLFDGHDASINIMRRIAQAEGAEVIHLGHNRSVAEIVDAALEEGVHVIGLSILSGSHVPLVRDVMNKLREKGAGEIPVVVGGIIPADMLTDMQGQLAQLVSLDALGIESIGEFGDLSALGGKLGEAAQEQIDNAIGGVQDQAQDAIDNATGNAEDAIKGLFGGGSDEDDDGP